MSTREPVGALHTEFSTNLAEFHSDMNKAAALVQRSSSTWKRSAQDAATGVEQSSAKTVASSQQLARGLSASFASAGAAARVLGDQVASQVASLAGSFSALTAGVGPAATAVLAASAIVSSYSAIAQIAGDRNDRLRDSFHAVVKDSDRYRNVMAAAEAIERQHAITLAGSTAEIMDAREELAALAKQREIATQTAARLGRELESRRGSLSPVAVFDLDNLKKTFMEADFLRTQLKSRAEALQQGLTVLEAEEARKRVAVAKEEQAQKTREAEAAYAKRIAMEQRLTVARAEAAAQAADLASAADELESQLAEFGASDREQEQARIERERARAVERLSLFDLKYWDKRDAIDRAARAKLALARARWEKDDLDQKQRADDRVSAEHETLQDRLLRAEQDLSFDTAQLGRDDTERAVEEVQRRYAALIEEARQHGLDVTQLELQVAENVSAIRRGAVQDDGPEPAAEIAATTRELTLMEEVAADAAQRLSYDLGGAFADVIQGIHHTGAEYRRFALQFIAQTAAMIVQQLALRAIMGALFPAAEVANQAAVAASVGRSAGMAAARVPLNAHGGSYTVSGAGGVDSKLAMLRVTPGERIDVTPPGRGRGPSVTVNNYTPAQVEVAPSTERPDDIVLTIVARDISRGGQVGRAIENSYGGRRTGRGV